MSYAQFHSCAAVVLYRPDPVILSRLVAGLVGLRIIVFANGPISEAARDALSGANVHLSHSEENIGLGAGLNKVVDIAREEGFEHVLLLDQDSEPQPGMIASLLSRAQKVHATRDKTGIVAPRLVPPEHENYKPIRYSWRKAEAPEGLRAVDFAPTSGSLLNIAAATDVGAFREDFFIGSLDVEWGFRAWNRGWGSYVIHDLTMPHRWGEPVDSAQDRAPQILRHTPLRNYYYARNVMATALLSHIPWRWRISSCFTLAGQTGLLAAYGRPGSLRPIKAGILDALGNRMGEAPSGLQLDR